MKNRFSLVCLMVIAAAAWTGSREALASATGIPTDGEYLIFVVDTSGSMRRYEWGRLRAQIAATLDAHPTVRGIQVLNDEGNHMFLASSGSWMADSPAQRMRILDELERWDSFSNSSPRQGIRRAIETYYDADKRISVFVYSDDLSSGSASIPAIVSEIDALNRGDTGGPGVRIHAVAFPVFYDVTGSMGTGGDYATLMSELTRHNGGGLVALPSRQVWDGVAPDNREPMTGLRQGAARTLFLIDTSARMAGVQWERAVASIDSLTSDLGANSEFQVIPFGAAGSLADGNWVSADDPDRRRAVVQSLAELEPAGEVSLAEAFSAMNRLQPEADNVYLLVAGLPGVSEPGSAVAVSERERFQNLSQASRGLARDLPVNVLLYGGQADPQAASAYWSLALATGGSLVAPAEDWP